LPERAKLVYVADEVERFAGYEKSDRIKVDDTGVGGGVTDILQDRGYNVIPVNFGGDANDQDRYPSTASEMWFEVGRIIQDIACPENDRLAAELVNRKSKGLDHKGRRMVEGKEEYKKRHGSKARTRRTPFSSRSTIQGSRAPVLMSPSLMWTCCDGPL
jgi:hypothetical protein